MPTVDGRRIDYQETGAGPAVLFLPGSFSTPAAWRAVQNHLPHGYRVVGTSLCGYGGTAETRTRDDPGMAHQVRVVETVANHIGAPVHLVGHSFGGAVALATALAGTIDILSIATFEADAADYAQLDMPVLLVRGARANPAIINITETLITSLPDVCMAAVDGASHFLITTHAQDCARLLADFLAEVTE